MRRQGRTLLAALALLALLTSATPPIARGEQGTEHRRTSLTSAWTTGIISDGAGLANIVVDDLDGDGVQDVVSCSQGAVYAVNQHAGAYEVARYSEDFQCGKVTAGDRDGDGRWEIYVVETGWVQPPVAQKMLHILDSATLKAIERAPVRTTAFVADLLVADVDGDGAQELVVVDRDATYVYDANTLALEWTAAGKGGNHLAAGDVDGDGDVEIVINGDPAHVLNARLQVEDFAYAGGFGPDMAVGDVDADGLAEIAGWTGAGQVFVFEADTLTTKWSVAHSYDVDRIAIGDMDGDGSGEVVTGNGQGAGFMIGHAGADGSRLWAVGNPEYGTDGLALGDTDNDGVPEVVWRAGEGTTERDALLIGDWQTESVEWNSVDLDNLVGSVAADVDLDGQLEIVVASVTTDSGYKGGMIQAYDGASYALEWAFRASDGSGTVKIGELDTGQVDEDPAPELVLAARTPYDLKILVYDGLTHSLEWQSGVLSNDNGYQIKVANVDASPRQEVLIALPDNRVQAWDASTGTKVWDSEMLSGAIRSLDVRDVDGDGTDELAVLTVGTLYIFETGTWDLETDLPYPGGHSMVLANADLSGPGEVLILTADSYSEYTLHALDATDYVQLWQHQFTYAYYPTLRAMDMDGDAEEEFLLLGGGWAPWGVPGSLLTIGSRTEFGTWIEYQTGKNWDHIYQAHMADLDNDAKPELLINSSHCVHVDNVKSTLVVMHRFYLPVVTRSGGA